MDPKKRPGRWPAPGAIATDLAAYSEKERDAILAAYGIPPKEMHAARVRLMNGQAVADVAFALSAFEPSGALRASDSLGSPRPSVEVLAQDAAATLARYWPDEFESTPTHIVAKSDGLFAGFRCVDASGRPTYTGGADPVIAPPFIDWTADADAVPLSRQRREDADTDAPEAELDVDLDDLDLSTDGGFAEYRLAVSRKYRPGLAPVDRIVDALENDLAGRAGFKTLYFQTTDAVRGEWRRLWREIIVRGIAPARAESGEVLVPELTGDGRQSPSDWLTTILDEDAP